MKYSEIVKIANEDSKKILFMESVLYKIDNGDIEINSELDEVFNEDEKEDFLLNKRLYITNAKKELKSFVEEYSLSICSLCDSYFHRDFPETFIVNECVHI